MPGDGDEDVQPYVAGEEQGSEEREGSEEEQDVQGQGDAAVQRSYVSQTIFLEAWRSAVRDHRGRPWCNRTQPTCGRCSKQGVDCTISDKAKRDPLLCERCRKGGLACSIKEQFGALEISRELGLPLPWVLERMEPQFRWHKQARGGAGRQNHPFIKFSELRRRADIELEAEKRKGAVAAVRRKAAGSSEGKTVSCTAVAVTKEPNDIPRKDLPPHKSPPSGIAPLKIRLPGHTLRPPVAADLDQEDTFPLDPVAVTQTAVDPVPLVPQLLTGPDVPSSSAASAPSPARSPTALQFFPDPESPLTQQQLQSLAVRPILVEAAPHAIQPARPLDRSPTPIPPVSPIPLTPIHCPHTPVTAATPICCPHTPVVPQVDFDNLQATHMSLRDEHASVLLQRDTLRNQVEHTQTRQTTTEQELNELRQQYQQLEALFDEQLGKDAREEYLRSGIFVAARPGPRGQSDPHELNKVQDTLQELQSLVKSQATELDQNRNRLVQYEAQLLEVRREEGYAMLSERDNKVEHWRRQAIDMTHVIDQCEAEHTVFFSNVGIAETTLAGVLDSRDILTPDCWTVIEEVQGLLRRTLIADAANPRRLSRMLEGMVRGMGMDHLAPVEVALRGSEEIEEWHRHQERASSQSLPSKRKRSPSWAEDGLGSSSKRRHS